MTVVAVLIAFDIVLRYYVDWLWFGEIGLREVFWTKLGYGLVLGTVFAALFFAIVYGSVAIARRVAPRYPAFEGIDVVEYVHEQASRRVRQVALALTALVAILVGFGAAGAWLTFARAFNAVAFGRDDPVFHHDLAFYVFTLPAWRWVYELLSATLVVALVASVIVHLIVGGIELPGRWLTPGARHEDDAGESAGDGPAAAEGEPAASGVEPGSGRTGQARRSRVGQALRHSRVGQAFGGIRATPQAVAHVSLLLAALFVLGALGRLLAAWDLLYSTAGAVFGAGYTDVHVRLWVLRALAALALLLGAALLYNATRARRLSWPPLAIGVWVAALVLFMGALPAAWQALIVNPNELDRELPYIGYELAATRRAYRLTGVAEKPYALTGDLTAAALAANSGTVDNIRLWDPETLQRSYTQLQQLRPYYRFTTVSVDRYRVDGEYRQTMLSPRELNVAGLPSQAQTWVNQHATYTHGYGVTVSAVNQVASSGSPDFLVQDVPITSDAPVLAVRQPRIYYGLSGTSYVLVRTTFPEFDYPGPGGDVYRRYDGRGGIPVTSFWTRLAFCARFSTIKFLTTTAITTESRAIIYNQLEARLEHAAPFLTFDRDPYMVVAGGRLFWIADAYTTTARYPYSQPLDGVNYIRNSVKVVVDAYDGTMTFYVFDRADPLLRTYEQLFPGMFRPASVMPAALRAHVRYPQDLFRAQSELFATYHVTDPTLLYNKGDQWQVPTGVSISGSGQMNPYYMIMRLPGQVHEEFVLILPFTPNGRSNMIGWLGAESDAPNYGEAVSFGFPPSQNVYGPAQVEAAVNQDPTISAQRTLWGQHGSQVIFGNLIVVPIENALLYVQPLYLEAQQTKLPQVQRVIVFYRSPAADPDLPSGQQQNVVMAPTLDQALQQIFGGAAAGEPGGATGAVTSAAVRRLLAQADARYARAQAALRAGDLAEFGRQITALGETLAQLRALH